MATIQYCTGNLFLSDANTLVNTVNCVGVMGAGIALQFKHQFPMMFERYRRDCTIGGVYTPGCVVPFLHTDGRIILNVATKNYRHHPSSYHWIDKIVNTLADGMRRDTVMAIPPLGCGHGGLDWKIVHSKIVLIFEKPEVPGVLLIFGKKI
jgi:O-acetyl-ADP-ribose deacetylase (regulator of RNase III)